METYFTLANAIDMAHTIAPGKVLRPGDDATLVYDTRCLALMVADHLARGEEVKVTGVGMYDEEIAPFGADSDHREIVTNHWVDITRHLD